MENRNMMRYTLALALLVALAAGIARAQAPAPNTPPEQEPGVGRVSLIQGNVSTQRGDSGEWTAVTPNTPIESGDSISTGPGSRAEVQLDWASVLRLSAGASARIATLSPSQIQIQAGQGTMNVSLLQAGEAALEIETPNVVIHPMGPGSYRVMVNSDDETQLIVRAGSAEVSTPQGSTRVERGQIITVQGPENDQQFQTVAAAGPDEWDRWNGDRDRLINGAQSWQHTNRYYMGSQDLDNYGQWTNVDEYGPVWAPAVAPGWAPYRVGRWVWEPFYGWTWVSYEPWGWAPYHYGRWFIRGANWYWWPGPVGGGYRPTWAPAYVSFFGFGGGGVSVGVEFGSVGWLPIGPADPFFPWYGRWGGRRNVVNVTNIYNVRNFNDGGRSIGPLAREGMHRYSNFDEAFNNPRMREGMTSMAANQFGRSGVPTRQTAISADSFRGGRLMTGGIPVNPTRESYRSTDWGAHRDSIPARAPASQRFMNDPRGSRGARPGGGPATPINPRGNGFSNPGGAAPGAPRGSALPAMPQATPQGTQGRGFGPGNAGGGYRREPGREPAGAAGLRPGSGMGTPNGAGTDLNTGAGAPPATDRQGNRGRGPWYRGVGPGSTGQGNAGPGNAMPGNSRPGNVQAAPSGGMVSPQFERPARVGAPSGPMPGTAQESAPAQYQRQRGLQGFNAPNRGGQQNGGAWNNQPPGGTQSFPPSRPAPSFERGGGGGRGPEAAPRSSERPALDLRQPILRERGGSPGGDSGQRGGNRDGGGGRGSDRGRSNFDGRSQRGR